MTQSPGEVDDHGLVPAAVLAAYDLLPEDGWRLDHVRTLHNSVLGLTRPSEDQPAWALRLHRTGWRSADQVSASLCLRLLGNAGHDQAPDLDHICLPMQLAGACQAIDAYVFVES